MYGQITKMAVGVLALQGSFNEHIAGARGVEIRKPEQLHNVSSLIIPGGESTTMAKLAELNNLNGKPVWGTCAGLIYLADRATGQKTGGQELIGGLHRTIHRNFFGSQSFEAELFVPEIVAKEGVPPSFRGVFIRAPAILEVGPVVEVLADFPYPSNKNINQEEDAGSPKKAIVEDAGSPKKAIVSVKQRNILATAFHPVLTADTRWHSYFLKMTIKVDKEASTQVASSPMEVREAMNNPKLIFMFTSSRKRTI